MTFSNKQVAAAIAAALGLGVYQAAEAFPTAAQAAAPAHAVYIAGSSAAANAVINYIETTVCGNAWSVFTTPTNLVSLPDFRAVSCTPVGGQVGAGSITTFFYRPEGGSAVGVLPVINNISVNQLNPSTAACSTTNTTQATAAWSCTGVQGTTPGNGTNDSFGPAGVSKHIIDIGVSDLEPGVFASVNIGGTNSYAGGGNHDPVGTYAASFTGPDVGVDTAQGFSNPSFGQAFGFVVSANLHTAGVTDLPKSQVAQLYLGNVTNWNQVFLATGAKVGVAAAPVICNREIGSGTRASASIFLYADGCNGSGNTIADLAGVNVGGVVQPTDNFATINELDCVNSHSNAIGYVSIDNFAKTAQNGSTFAQTWPITVDGVADYPNTGPATNPAGNGARQYAVDAAHDWFEGSLNLNPHASGDGSNFYTNFLVPTLQSQDANVGSSYQFMAIPGQGTNVAGATGAKGVYTNVKTRGGNSCTP